MLSRPAGRRAGRTAHRSGRRSERDVLVAEVAFGDVGSGGKRSAGLARRSAAFARPENRDKGAIKLDGRMVEPLHAESARRIVALAQAIAALEGD